MCFNHGPEMRVPSPNRYIADAKFCFWKNKKRIIIIKVTEPSTLQDSLGVRQKGVVPLPLSGPAGVPQ